MESLEDAISRAVFAMAREDAAKIEAACEDALQGGEHGVYVLRLGPRVLLAEVSDLVPYGEIYEFQEPWGRISSWRA